MPLKGFHKSACNGLHKVSRRPLFTLFVLVLPSVREDVARTAHIFRGTLAIARSYDGRGRQEHCEVGSGEPLRVQQRVNPEKLM